MLLMRTADTVATVEGHVLQSVKASCAGGAGVLEQGMSSRDRREPGRPCWFREEAVAVRESSERSAKSIRESEWLVVPEKLGNRARRDPAEGRSHRRRRSDEGKDAR
jgi:hypothetical protein